MKKKIVCSANINRVKIGRMGVARVNDLGQLAKRLK